MFAASRAMFSFAQSFGQQHRHQRIQRSAFGLGPFHQASLAQT
jgi:hypothetical protein